MFCNCYLFCNKVSSRILLTSKGFSVFFWITLSHEVSRHFPHTHNHISIHELQESSVYSLYTGRYTPSLVENLMSHGRRNKFFWIVSSRLHPHSNFPKHSRKSHTVQCEQNPGRSPHTDLRSASTSTTKRNR